MPARAAIWHAIRSSNGSSVAAGPSTCGDGAVGLHLRTTGDPGQGVDGRLPYPVFSHSAPNPSPGDVLRSVNTRVFPTTPADSQKAEAGPVTAGCDTMAHEDRSIPRLFTVHFLRPYRRRPACTPQVPVRSPRHPGPPRRSMSLRDRCTAGAALASADEIPCSHPTGRRYGRAAAAFVNSGPADARSPGNCGSTR